MAVASGSRNCRPELNWVEVRGRERKRRAKIGAILSLPFSFFSLADKNTLLIITIAAAAAIATKKDKSNGGRAEQRARDRYKWGTSNMAHQYSMMVMVVYSCCCCCCWCCTAVVPGGGKKEEEEKKRTELRIGSRWMDKLPKVQLCSKAGEKREKEEMMLASVFLPGNTRPSLSLSRELRIEGKTGKKEKGRNCQ